MQSLQTTKTDTLSNKLNLKRQTQMHCTICKYIAESYNQKDCYNCGSIYKWSIPWKNDRKKN